MERSVLRGLAVFRWTAWVWMATVLVLARAALVRPAVAVALVGAALVVTVWATVRLRAAEPGPATGGVVGAEVTVALGLQLADGFVYRAPHVFEPEQPLGVAWPIAAVLSAGVAFGPVAGIGAAVLVGTGRTVSSVLSTTAGPDAWLGPLTPQETLSLVTTTVMYALAGGVGGYLVRVLRAAEWRALSAERDLAQARERERVGRRLHDGVLQTLALVSRRSDDPEVVALARDTEQQLRDELFGQPGAAVIGKGDVGDALRATAARARDRSGLQVRVLVPDDLPDLADDVRDALAGAVGEALANVAKHAHASEVVVYAEPVGDGVEVSVRDDGCGFDADAVDEGVGWRSSIRGRLAEVGGHAEVESAPGRGTEVRVRVG